MSNQINVTDNMKVKLIGRNYISVHSIWWSDLKSKTTKLTNERKKSLHFFKNKKINRDNMSFDVKMIFVKSSLISDLWKASPTFILSIHAWRPWSFYISLRTIFASLCSVPAFTRRKSVALLCISHVYVYL